MLILINYLEFLNEKFSKKFFMNLFLMQQIQIMKYLIINHNQLFFLSMMLNISIKNLGNIFLFLVFVFFVFLSIKIKSINSGSAPTSLLIMAMRDPTLTDDELQIRMNTFRDLSTTKHMELMGLIKSIIFDFQNEDSNSRS